MTCWLPKTVQTCKNLVSRGAMWLGMRFPKLSSSFWRIVLICFTSSNYWFSADRRQYGTILCTQSVVMGARIQKMQIYIYIYMECIYIYTLYFNTTISMSNIFTCLVLEPVRFLQNPYSRVAGGGSDDWLNKSSNNIQYILEESFWATERELCVGEIWGWAMHLFPLKDPDDEEEKENRGDAAWIAAMS